MIDHSKCQHENTKSERAKCRARQRAGHPHFVDRHDDMTAGERMSLECSLCYPSVCDADLITEQSGELSRVLRREDARPSLWVALSSPEVHGYIVYTDTERVLIHDLQSGVAKWHNWAKIDGKIFDQTPSV